MELSPNSSEFSVPEEDKNNKENINNCGTPPMSSNISSGNKTEEKDDTITHTKIDAKKVLDNPENRKISKENIINI